MRFRGINKASEANNVQLATADRPAACRFFLLQLTFWRYRLEFSLSPYLHLGMEHVFVEKKSSGLMTSRGVTAHSSSGAEIWEAAWLTSLMWILPSHKTSKSAECVIILATNQPSICDWNHTTASQRNHGSSRLGFSLIFICLTSMKSHFLL